MASKSNSQRQRPNHPEPRTDQESADFPAEAANDLGQAANENYPYSQSLTEEAGENVENAAQNGGSGPRIDDLGIGDLTDSKPDEAVLNKNLSELKNVARGKDVPLFDQSIEAPPPEESEHIANRFEQPGSGYLIVLTEDSAMQAELYDESLQYVSDVDLDSEEATQLLENAEELTDLDSAEMDAVFGDLPPEQKKQAKVYRIHANIMSERDSEIEEIMLENDDERPYGYNDEDEEQD